MIEKQAESPQKMNIEEDTFHCPKPQQVPRFGEERKLIHKSFSQVELTNKLKENHSQKQVEEKVDPFQNLNAAVNVLNSSSVKRNSMLPSEEDLSSENPTTESRTHRDRRKARRQSGSLMKKELAEEYEFPNEEGFKDTVKIEESLTSPNNRANPNYGKLYHKHNYL